MVLNTTVPSLILKKKSNSIAYHRVREAVAAGIMHFFHIRTTENIADVLTKPIGPKVFYGHIKGSYLEAYAVLKGSIRNYQVLVSSTCKYGSGDGRTGAEIHGSSKSL